MAGYANRKFVAYPISEVSPQTGRALINWVADVYVGGDKPPIPRDWNRRVDQATGVEEVILRGAFANDLSSTFHQQPP